MKCEYCNKKHDGNYGSGRFCNKSCATGFSTSKDRKAINKKISRTLGGKNYVFKPREKYCLYCGEKLRGSGRKFCSRICHSDYEYLIYINKWKLGLEKGLSGKTGTSARIKKYFIQKYNNRCQKCDWAELNPATNNVPLDLHHVDGNHKNNAEENLELICSNCHSITPTYKSLNSNCSRDYKNTRKVENNNTRTRKFVKLKCPSCNIIFDIPENKSLLQKGSIFTCCSAKCRGKFSKLIQLEGYTAKVLKQIKENLIVQYNK